MTKVMKAVLLHGYGDANHLAYEDIPIPHPSSGEVLVKVIATSINPVDWKLPRGDPEGYDAAQVSGDPRPRHCR
jgi:NADPH:quinone reductase-like Zn-dependent oxidoreductase